MSGTTTCAACGLAIRKGEKVGFLECYVVHRHCASLPQSMWSVSTAPGVRALVEQYETLRRHDADALQMARDRSDKVIERSERTIEQLNTRIRQLERDLKAANLNLNREREQPYATYDRVAATPYLPERNTLTVAVTEMERRFRAGTIGMAVGRGIWGIASWLAHALDRLDPAVARFALLDLS